MVLKVGVKNKKVIFHVFKNWQVLEDLVFCRLKLWCVDDRVKGFLLSWQAFFIIHKQVGVVYLFTLRIFLACLHVGLFRQWNAPSHST